MKLNRKWLLVIALVVSMTMAISGTLAYLTDRDTAVNTFTLGEVDIKLEEDFTPNSPIKPGQTVNKDAKITNEGEKPAWVWMTVSVDEDLKDYVKLNWANGFAPMGNTCVVSDGKAVWTVLVDTALAGKASTPNILDSVTLNGTVDFQNGEYVLVNNGVTTKLDGLNSDGVTMNVTVDAYAVQVDGLADVKAAYKAYAGQWGLASNIITSTAELAERIAAGETNLILAAGTYQLPDVAKGKTLTINGTEDAVIEHVNQGEDGMNYSLEGSTVTFNGVTIKTTSGTYRGFARSTAIEYNECNFVGSYTLGAGNHTFNKCNFNLQNNYVWTWGGEKVVFDGCTFDDENGVAKAILVHNTVPTEVTVKNCAFNATTGAKTWDGIDVAAVSIDPNGAHTAKVTFEGTNTVSSAFYDNWQIKYAEDEALVTVVE